MKPAFSDALELCDGVDNDCDDLTDEEDAIDELVWFVDQDGDGFGTSTDTQIGCEQPDGYALQAGDCEDNDVTIHRVQSKSVTSKTTTVTPSLMMRMTVLRIQVRLTFSSILMETALELELRDDSALSPVEPVQQMTTVTTTTSSSTQTV